MVPGRGLCMSDMAVGLEGLVCLIFVLVLLGGGSSDYMELCRARREQSVR